MHPRHLVTAGLFVATALFTSPSTARAQGSAEIAGGWIVTSWTSPDGKVNNSPQRGLFIFTQSGHYSIMYIPSDTARSTYDSANRSEAEELASLRDIVANSGRYRVEGNTLSYEAFVAKDANYTAAFNATTRANAVKCEFSVTNGILTLKWLDGRSAGTVAKLRRPGTPRS